MTERLCAQSEWCCTACALASTNQPQAQAHDDSQSHFNATLPSTIASAQPLFNYQQTLPDVYLSFHTSTWLVHSAVLSHWSPLLAYLLQCKTHNKQGKPWLKLDGIHDLSVKGVSAALQWMYGQLTCTIHDFYPSLMVSQALHMHHMHQQLQSWLVTVSERSADIGHLCWALDTAVWLLPPCSMHLAQITANAARKLPLIQSQIHSRLQLESLVTLLTHNRLQCTDELHVFQLSVRWVEVNVSGALHKQQSGAQDRALRALVCARLQLCTQQQLACCQRSLYAARLGPSTDDIWAELLELNHQKQTQ